MGQELLNKKDETEIQEIKFFFMNVRVQKAGLNRSVSGNISHASSVALAKKEAKGT